MIHSFLINLSEAKLITFNGPGKFFTCNKVEFVDTKTPLDVETITHSNYIQILTKKILYLISPYLFEIKYPLETPDSIQK